MGGPKGETTEVLHPWGCGDHLDGDSLFLRRLLGPEHVSGALEQEEARVTLEVHPPHLESGVRLKILGPLMSQYSVGSVPGR